MQKVDWLRGLCCTVHKVDWLPGLDVAVVKMADWIPRCTGQNKVYKKTVIMPLFTAREGVLNGVKIVPIAVKKREEVENKRGWGRQKTKQTNKKPSFRVMIIC